MRKWSNFYRTHHQLIFMSGYKNFAVVGSGEIGSFIIRQLLTDKAAGIVDNVVVLTRQASVQFRVCPIRH